MDILRHAKRTDTKLYPATQCPIQDIYPVSPHRQSKARSRRFLLCLRARNIPRHVCSPSRYRNMRSGLQSAEKYLDQTLRMLLCSRRYTPTVEVDQCVDGQKEGQNDGRRQVRLPPCGHWGVMCETKTNLGGGLLFLKLKVLQFSVKKNCDTVSEAY